jgi:hypothetical protein
MCLLYHFTEKEVYRGKSFMVGWKRFHNMDGNIQGRVLNEIKLDQIILPSVLEEFKTESLSCDTNLKQYYRSGFHIFLNRKDAEFYYQTPWNERDDRCNPTCRVLFNDIRYIGINGSNNFTIPPTESGGLCVVANELLVKSEDWEIAKKEHKKYVEKLEQSTKSND